MSVGKVIVVIVVTILAMLALQFALGPTLQGFGAGLFGDDLQSDEHDLESDSGETLVDLDKQYQSWKTTVVVGMPTIAMIGSVLYAFVWVFRRQMSTGRM